MPKSILEKIGKKSKDINSVKNYQLIHYAINRGNKNDKPFKDWVTNTENVPNLDSYLELHLIPNDQNLWDEDKFEEFSKNRGNKIIAKLKTWIVSPPKPPLKHSQNHNTI